MPSMNAASSDISRLSSSSASRAATSAARAARFRRRAALSRSARRMASDLLASRLKLRECLQLLVQADADGG
jgi:hypothetical protein